jgi:hypothetical protein
MRFEVSKNKYKKKVETETALKCSDFGLCHGTTRKTALFPLFSKFCSKNDCPSPPLVFVVCLAVVHLDWASCAAP